jgi:hypothetical protein
LVKNPLSTEIVVVHLFTKILTSKIVGGLTRL